MGRGHGRRLAGVFFVLLAAPMALVSAVVDEPLPDAEAFYAAARANVDRSQREAQRYAYLERRTELNLNPFGRMGSGETRAYEVAPSVDGKTVTRRLVERDGRPVSGIAPERSDVRERRGQPGRRTAAEDAVSVLDFAMDRREMLHDRSTIVVRFSPKANAKAETRQGRLARAFAGSIWVDEADREVVRVEAVSADDISYGLGMIARLNKGTTVTLTRARVDSRAWLPTSIRFTGEGRALLFRRLTVDHVIEWSGYRRIVE